MSKLDIGPPGLGAGTGAGDGSGVCVCVYGGEQRQADPGYLK